MNGVESLDPQVLEQARVSRDARFDGLFFVAVTSTGIFCRPVCPAPTALARNVRYFADAASAAAEGFRPCLRCRPELAPGCTNWHPSEQRLATALRLIDEDRLDDGGMAELARRVALSPRQLRRLFSDRLGVSPLQVMTTRRLLFAKQLLTETALPITEVALAAGYRSQRRFNAAFQAGCSLAPRELRRKPQVATPEAMVLRLAYRPPYDFEHLLQFLQTRALPGLERVHQGGYERVFGDQNHSGWLRVEPWPGEHALRLHLHGAAPGQLRELLRRVRRVFDLDANPLAISAVLEKDPLLAESLHTAPGLRVPGAWDAAELAVRAVLGQQVSVAAARCFAIRILDHCGPRNAPDQAKTDLNRLWPPASALTALDASVVGIPERRAACLRRLAEAMRAGALPLSADRPLDELISAWTALPGIGPWTAHYIALRALGHPDAFPAGDLVLRKVTGLSETELQRRSQAWRPWRGYAVMHLWRQANINRETGAQQ